MLTLEETMKRHKELWDWVANETEKRKHVVSKKEYFNAHPDLRVPYSYCWLCSYAMEQLEGTDPFSQKCSHCPVDWGEDPSILPCSNNPDSPYVKWAHTSIGNDWSRAAELAREIANIPRRTYENN